MAPFYKQKITKNCIFSKKTLDKRRIMLYNGKALAGVAESADAHV